MPGGVILRFYIIILNKLIKKKVITKLAGKYITKFTLTDIYHWHDLGIGQRSAQQKSAQNVLHYES